MKTMDAFAGILFAGALTFSLSLIGCGNQPSTSTQTTEAPAQEQVAEEQTSEEQTTTSQQQTTTDAPAVQIDEAQAKQIAFSDAGVAEQDATLVKCELDTDDGYTKYEIEFLVGMTEYEYDIDANTGAILAASSEIDN